MSGLTDEQRETLRATVCFHPERLPATAHAHTRLVDALAPVVAAMLAEQREQIAADIEAERGIYARGSDGWGYLDVAARIARGGAL